MQSLPVKTHVVTKPSYPDYRADIDGLRAFAVLSVVGFHAFPGIVSGGFIGVDIFFVISGFLISTIIFENIDQHKFTFWGFYKRRIKRIFPALIAVMSAAFIYGCFFLLPDELSALGWHMAAGAGFVINFALWQEAGYFATATELKPLMHLWSLSIEEQFYLLYPPMVFVLWKCKRIFFPALFSVLVASFALSIWTVYKDPTAAFYLPHVRFWELLTGSAIAHLLFFKREWVDKAFCLSHKINWPQIANIAIGVGLVLMLIAVFGINKKSLFPGWVVCAPVLGAALIIVAGAHSSIAHRILGQRYFVYIGLISYPLYLWHWIILSFLRIGSSYAPSNKALVVVVVLSFLLASVTYHFIERPIRFSKDTKFKPIILCCLLLLIALTGLYTRQNGGFNNRIPEELTALAQFKYGAGTDIDNDFSCWLNKEQGPDAFPDKCIEKVSPQGDAKAPLTVIWGDSHAARLFAGIKKFRQNKNIRLAQLTRNSCPPFMSNVRDDCKKGNLFVLKKIKDIQPDTVILFARWNSYMANAEDNRLDEMQAVIEQLKDAGIRRVILAGPVPQWNIALPRNLANLYRSRHLKILPARTDYGIVKDVEVKDLELKSFFASKKIGVDYVSVWDIFCDPRGCLTRTADSFDSLVSWDYGHLTLSGAEYLAARMNLWD